MGGAAGEMENKAKLSLSLVWVGASAELGNFTQILYKCHQNIDKLPPKYDFNITQKSVNYVPNITEVLPKYQLNISQIMPWYQQNVTKISLKLHPKTAR